MSDLNALLAQLQATTSQTPESEPPKSNNENSQLNSLLNSLPQQNQQAQQGSPDLQSALAGLNNLTTVQQVAQPQTPPNSQSPAKQSEQNSNSDLQSALAGLQNIQTQDPPAQQNQSALSNLLGQLSQTQPPQQNQSPLSGLLNQSSPPQQQQSPLSGLLGQSQPQQQQQSPLSGLLGQSQPQQQQQSPLSGLLSQSQPQQQQQSPLSGLLGQSQPQSQQNSPLSGLLSQTPPQNPQQQQQNSLSNLLSSLNNSNQQSSSPLSGLLQSTSSGTSQLSPPTDLSSLVSKPASATASNSSSKVNLATEMQPLDLKEKVITPYKKRTDPFQSKKSVLYDKSVPFPEFINKAEPFTVIELPNGCYELGTTIKYPLHIKSANGARATIKGVESTEIIISASPYLILENIDFVQESSTFGAIIVAGGFTRIINCNIKTKTYSPLSIQGGQSPSIVEVEDCHFIAGEKSCVTLQKNSTLYLSKTKIENSQIYGIWAQLGAKLFVDSGCVISNNMTGINIQKDCQLRVDQNVEIINSKDSGIEIVDKSIAYIDGIKITETKSLAAIYTCFNSFTTIKNSQLIGNDSIGLRAESDSNILSINNTLKDAGPNQLVIAHGNSCIQCENDQMSGNCHTAVVSIEKGYVQCNNVKIDSISGVGVVTYDYGSIRMTKSSITRINQVCIQTRDQSKLYLEDVVISDSKESGISLTSNPMAFLKGVKISKMNEIGIQISNVNNGFVDLVDCDSFENNKGGILIQGNVPEGCCTIKNSKFYNNDYLGVNTNGNNTKPKFINCSFTSNKVVGIHVLNCAEIELVNSIFKGDGQNGIYVDNAIAHLDKADFSNFSTAAITCTRSGNLDLKDSVLHDNLKFACYVADDKSHVKFVNCKFMNHNRSETLHCKDRAVIRCVDCTIDSDFETHAHIYNGGKVSMKNCDLSKSSIRRGIYVRDNGTFKCNNVKIHNEPGMAIEIGKKGIVIAINSTFANNANCGVLIDRYGSGTFTNCVFDSNGQTGIQMNGGNLTLNNCSISNHENQGIFLTKSSNFVDNGTKFSNNGQNNIIYSQTE